MTALDENQLKMILVNGNRNGWMSGKPPERLNGDLFSKQFFWEDKALQMGYWDMYEGHYRFQGIVAVGPLSKKRKDWAMGYSGGVHRQYLESPVADDTLKFLRKALQTMPEGLPLRGRHIFPFEDGSWTYSFKIRGDIGNFDGDEEISRNHVPVYSLKCVGGYII